MVEETENRKLRRLFPGCAIEHPDCGEWPGLWQYLYIPNGKWFFNLFTKWKCIAWKNVSEGIWFCQELEYAEKISEELGVCVKLL